MTAPDLTILRRDILARLAEIDGASSFHGAIFYSSTATQELARYQTAQRLGVASDAAREDYIEKLRLFRASDCAMGCCFCDRSFSTLDDAALCGDQLIHKACEAEWRAFLDARIGITAAGRAALAEDDAEQIAADARRTA